MWKTIKFLSLLIKLNAPNISGYEITMNIFIEKSSNYRTFRFSSSTTSSKTVSTGLRKRLVDSQTRSYQPARGSGTAFRFFSRIPRDWLQQHRSLIAQMISSSVLRGENRGTRTNTQRYIYMYKRSCEWTEMRDRVRKRLSSSSSNASLFHRLSKILSS